MDDNIKPCSCFVCRHFRNEITSEEAFELALQQSEDHEYHGMWLTKMINRLKPYIQHDDECPQVVMSGGKYVDKCTCGLDDILERLDKHTGIDNE